MNKTKLLMNGVCPFSYPYHVLFDVYHVGSISFLFFGMFLGFTVVLAAMTARRAALITCAVTTFARF